MMAAMQQQMKKRLGELVLIDDQALAAIAVGGLQLDSRRITPGDVFLACKGHTVDGRNFIEQAIGAGAVAVLADKDTAWPKNRRVQGVPVIVQDNLAAQLSQIAGNFYGHPSRQMPVVAVTGTNGKTSCTQLLMQLLNRLGRSCGVIGTLGVGVDGNLQPISNTTPDAVSIQHYIARWLDEGVDTVAMEVSSHGLQQERVAALCFELALFTNLTRDHLDYHGSMQAYADSKAKLFRQKGLKKAVINRDDPFASSLASAVATEVDLIGYSLQSPQDGIVAADVWVDNISYHSHGVRAFLHSPWGELAFESPLLGKFNLSNVVAVISCLGMLGYPMNTVVAEVSKLKTVPGRMQRIESITDLTVVVDYAHTPDALQQALLAMRLHTQGRLWCVFGCGGDRDQGKRPQMGAVAQKYADCVVITSDNPRSESAGEIIDAILSTVDCPSLVEEDRGRAIDFVIANAAAGDSVLIAGKGHEEYQQIGTQQFPFSDMQRARLALSRRADLQSDDMREDEQ
jgi:UDP-N-acetylmuramoyl-L-alanyl-D-glutamate--2,6-diaminopimelate ligase